MEARGATARSRKRKSAALQSTEDGEGVDRISSLLDVILREIISLLPTKEGARTRILASRWRNLWCSAPLNLECSTLRTDTISRILSTHPGPGRRLCLDSNSYSRTPASTFDAWLRSAALNNLEELDFACMYMYIHSERPPPASVFRFSQTLRVATIERCDLSYGTVQGLHFPVLKLLGLVCVTMTDCSLQTMIAGCPALEFLLIHHCNGPRSLRVNSHSIRRIGFRDNIFLNDLIIESAPCLEALLHLDSRFVHVSVLSAPKLDTLLFSNSTRIVFGSTIIQGLQVDSLTLPVCTLKSLVLKVPCINLSLATVIGLLRCFPCLEKLYIMCNSTGHRNPWRRKHRDLIKRLDIRLKKVVLEDYWGRDADKYFVSFFALNARALESMTLVVSNKSDEFLAKERTTKLWLENMAVNGARFHFTTHSGHSFGEIYHVRDLYEMDCWK